MASDKIVIKCPLCDKKYIAKNKDQVKDAKQALYQHMEEEHKEAMGNMSASQVYFNHRNKKTGGRCVMSGKPTEWNEKTERYERFHSEKERLEYREQFKKRMKNKYGKEHLLDDPEKQKEMLANRSISGTYKWDNGHEVTYTGSYEEDFLGFMEHFMNWENPEDIMMPAPQIFDYKDKDGRVRFYIPDVYITSLDLIIEIKGSDFDDTGNKNSNKHEWRKREKEKEVIKDKILKKSKIDYIKIVDKNYTTFIKYLMERKNKED